MSCAKARARRRAGDRDRRADRLHAAALARARGAAAGATPTAASARPGATADRMLELVRAHDRPRRGGRDGGDRRGLPGARGPLRGRPRRPRGGAERAARDLSPHRRLHAASAQTVCLLGAGRLDELAEAHRARRRDLVDRRGQPDVRHGLARARRPRGRAVRGARHGRRRARRRARRGDRPAPQRLVVPLPRDRGAAAVRRARAHARAASTTARTSRAAGRRRPPAARARCSSPRSRTATSSRLARRARARGRARGVRARARLDRRLGRRAARRLARAARSRRPARSTPTASTTRRRA